MPKVLYFGGEDLNSIDFTVLDLTVKLITTIPQAPVNQQHDLNGPRL